MIAAEGWQRIERVLRDREATERPYEAPTAGELDPLTLAQKLVALAKEYDQDAREARQAAASCRAFAADLRAGC